MTHGNDSTYDERQPLLSNDDKKLDETTIAHEGRVLLQYTIPLAAINLLRTFVQTISVLCLGRLGTKELASANLGNLTVNVLGYAIQIGLISSLDTLANQAIKSHSPKLTSIYTMRAFVVSCMVMPPMYLVLWNSRSIISFVIPHADPEMIRLAALYVKITSLGIPPLVGFECLRRYLASMGLMRGPTIAYVIVTPFSIFMTYWLTFNWLGFFGAPLAVTITYWSLFFILAFYTWMCAPRHAWAGVSMVIFEDLGVNFRYGIAGVISTCSEWYAFEIMSLGASYLGEVPQAVNAIALTLSGVCWQIPYAINQASSIRIGNLLGANLWHKAKRASQAASLMGLIIAGILAIAIQIFRNAFGHLFTNDPQVLEIFDRMAYFVAIVTFFDGVQGACTGILKGAGLPTTASRINLISYWLVGLPAGAWLTIKTKKVEGLFTGLSLAVFIAASLMLWRISSCDWEERAEETQKRLESSDAAAGLSNIVIVGDV